MKRFLKLILVVGVCVAAPQLVPHLLPAQQSVQAAMAQQGGGVADLHRNQTAVPQAGMQAAPEDISRVPMVAGDVLSVQVFEAPDLSGLYSVDSAGDLTLPLVGKIHVDGLTLSETQSKIADALKAGFILQPSVAITFQQYVPTFVTVMGEVETPGRYALLAPHSLPQVLSMAGGQTSLSSGSLEIKRKGPDGDQKIDIKIQRGSGAAATGDVQILPGDEVTVKRAGVVYVLGGVFRPGGYVMQEGGHLDVIQAIALASGTTFQAAVGSMRVMRHQPDGSVVEIDLNYKKIMAGKEQAIALMPQDVVYVPISKAKAILTGGAASVLGATTSAAIIYSK
jgi:polysaccharide biosynthesis/export protein